MPQILKACVIGSPISHSRSPLIHNYWLKHYRISGSYERIEIKPDELEAFLDRIRQGEFVGCNVTLPLKERACELVDMTDQQTRKLKSLNTIFMSDGKCWGISTDGSGFMANLVQSVPGWQIQSKHVLVLGAGGAARALVAALIDAGVDRISIANRTLQRAEKICADYMDRVSAISWDALEGALPNTDLLVNSTSLGMTGQPSLDISIQKLKPRAVVADIVYAPLETQLLHQAAALGYRCVDGLGMLLHQAVPGFEKWFGVRPEVTAALRNIIADDIIGR